MSKTQEIGLQTETVTWVSPLNFMPDLGEKKKKCLGRGIGSGKGKTSGKGHKGAKARSGVCIGRAYEGGQTPITRRMPKKGFNPLISSTKKVLLSLSKVHMWIEQGRLTSGKTVNEAWLREVGHIRGHHPVVIRVVGLPLGEDAESFSLGGSIHFEVSAVSKGAQSLIEKAKGTWNLIPA